MDTKDYSRGYAAGRKYAEKQIQEMRREIAKLSSSRLNKVEESYFRCLEIVLRECKGWSIGGKKIDSADGYCKLAKIFRDESIEAGM